MKPSLGSKLLKATGYLDGQDKHGKCNIKKVIQYLNETRILLKKKREKEKFKNKIYSEKFIVDSLFKIELQKKESPKAFYNAQYCVIDQFLEYFAKNYRKEHKLIIVDFVYELGRSEILIDGNFFESWPRRNTPYTIHHFYEARDLFLIGKQTLHISKTIMSILGLRQSLELRFRRILGIAAILNNGIPAKIKHDFIPKFIINNRDKITMSNFRTEEVACLWTIYEWTNYSIHFMVSPPPWLIWKAFDFCEKLFSIQSARLPNNGSLHDSVIINEVDLAWIRSLLEKEVNKLFTNFNPQNIEIRYGEIEARIENTLGNFVIDNRPFEMLEKIY